jgi:perosamine synthetase
VARRSKNARRPPRHLRRAADSQASAPRSSARRPLPEAERIPVGGPTLGRLDERFVLRALRSGYVSSRGPFVPEFERRFASYIGVGHAVAVSSGTAALHVALLALGIGPGDEVLVPSFAMIAVPNAVRYTGATPVLVDSERRTWNIDPSKLDAATTHRTKAALVVHTYGHPADMGPILAWARRRGAFVVEDAAEAHGATYRGRRVGGLGDVACFSFYANKIMTTGEGGMVVTNRASLAERSALLRDQGFGGPRRFLHEIVGYNYRLTSLQAALGLAQLRRIRTFVEAHRRHARLYNRLLASVPSLTLPPEATWARSVYWMYSVQLPAALRDPVQRRLAELHGIETRPFFVPIHLQPIYSSLEHRGGFPVAEELSLTGLNLPSASDLTHTQIVRVCDALRESLEALSDAPGRRARSHDGILRAYKRLRARGEALP